MRHYGLYVFDLDGTLYRGNEALPGTVDVVDELRERGATIRYLTNNSSQTPADQAKKLRQMGFSASPAEILTSGVGAAQYLAKAGLRRIFLVGEIGLVQVLEDYDLEPVAADAESDAVLVGICRSFTYSWMNDALQHLLNGAKFVATNCDATYPVEGGRLIPGSGAIVASIQTCSGQAPEVIGKPNPYLVQLLLEETGVVPADTLVVGDRYETDILSGLAAGCDTHLVLTGVSSSAPAGQSFSETLAALL